MAVSRIKYYQTILFLCKKLGKEVRGKKKLAKLLYYIDFDMFEKNGRSITGDIYKSLPMGPFPSALQEITSEMETKNMLAVGKADKNDGYIPTEVYKSLIEADLSIFDEDEKKILNRVVEKYGGLNGKQLEDLTHAEAPYVGSKLKDEIPYELAYYRGTDFGDA